MLQEGIQSLLGEDDPEKGKKKTVVDNKLREDWNLYSDWLTTKGYRGKANLDSAEGYALFDKFIKENPTTSLSREALPLIRQDLVNYRTWVLNKDKQMRATLGQGVLKEGVTEENFMRHIVDNEGTMNPDHPGTHLTATKIPSEYMKTFVNKKLVEDVRKGFSTIKDKK